MKRFLTIAVIAALFAFVLASCSSPKLSSGTANNQADSALVTQAQNNITTSPPNTDEQISSQDANAASGINKKSVGTMTVKFIDVGQGDSILILTPSGKTMLIDAGPGASSGNVSSALKSLSISNIDVLVATHPHEDHIGGMTSIINSFGIGAIYMPKATATTKTYEYLLTAIKNKSLTVNTAKAGVTIDIDSALSVVMLAPVSSSYGNVNDYSAVIKIIYNNTSFLFAGDASNNSESEMLATGNLKADVLKVGHHGSATSSSDFFLDAVSPKYAIINVGAGNSYGHPTEETLSRLAAHNISVYRTDEAGTITVTSDGNNILLDKSASPIKPNAPPVAPPAAPPANNIAPPANDNFSVSSVTVYGTNTGTKYHLDGCSYLSKSKIPMTLSEAKAKGLGPCSRCHPPT